MFEQLEKTMAQNTNDISELKNDVAELKKQTTTAIEKLSYSIKEAAQVLGIKPTTVRAWLENGKLTGIKSEKLILIHKVSITNLLNQKP